MRIKKNKRTRKMRTLKEMNKMIEKINESAPKLLDDVMEVINYANLTDELNYGYDLYCVYESAIERIVGKYVPDLEHAETYYGGHEPEPVTFDEIKRLYKEWGIEDDFETFFETWENA